MILLKHSEYGDEEGDQEEYAQDQTGSEINVVQCKVHHQIGSPPDHGHGYGEGGGCEEPQLGEAIETEDALGYHVLSLREVY